MIPAEPTALVDRLRAMPTETEWCEWKRNHVALEELGEYLSALANKAALHREPCSYLLNLVQELRLSGRIANRGTRAEPRWVLSEDGGGRA